MNYLLAGGMILSAAAAGIFDYVGMTSLAWISAAVGFAILIYIASWGD